jgi:Cupin-like domain
LPLTHAETFAFGETAPPEILAGPLDQVAVESRGLLSREEFSHEYLRGWGKPVVVTGATDDWAARGKWTFDFFAQRYGRETILAVDNQIKPTVGRRLEFGEFLIYCQCPSLSILGQVVTPHPLYASYRPFSKHPELLDDFRQFSFVENSFLQLRGELREWYNESFGWLFFGPKGTVTPLHVDHFMTHSWLAQLVGRKRVLLCSPEDAGRIPGLSPPDALLPDLFFQKEDGPVHACVEGAVKTYEAIVGPGEVIFIPAGWAHTVTSLEPSITMSFDVVNEFNLIPHLMMISRKLPQWSQKINTPTFRRANQVQWSTKDFALLHTSPPQPGLTATAVQDSRRK